MCIVVDDVDIAGDELSVSFCRWQLSRSSRLLLVNNSRYIHIFFRLSTIDINQRYNQVEH
jgi:hypothetical protein